MSVRTLIMMMCTLLVNGVSFISSIIFARILSTSDYGVFSLFLSWVNIFSLFLGGQTYGTLNNAKIEFDEKEYPNYCYNAFLISTIGAFLCGILSVILNRGLACILEIPEKCVIWVVLCSYGTYMVSFLSRYLIIEKKVIHNLIFSLMITVLSVVFSIVLVIYSGCEGYYGRILGYSIIYLLAGIGVAIFFCRTKNKTVNKSFWTFCLKMSFPLVLHGLSGVLLAQGDRIMLMEYLGKSSVGVYSFCYMLAMPVSVIANAINTTWTPEYFRLKSENENADIMRHYNKQIFLMLGIACGYMLIAPEVLKLVSTQEYWEGVAVIPLVIIAYFFNFLYFIPVNHEFYYKDTRYIAVSTLLAAIVNILLNAVLIRRYEMYGAALATIIAYIFLFLIHDMVARKVIGNYKVSWRLYIKGIVPLSACSFLYFYMQDNIIIRWAMAGLIGIILIFNVIKKKELF